ncbi:hypothetical protein MKW98_013084 [Papaver atlanticum]|uniref:Uncharacterized protein n=1 Tax=Papaver atlanticum TaxID=357466 RepID=A0AAD4T8G1_9MAGN|nr:hypothetical protein MKW98_013084 [Papaver atlanticum]
MSLTRDCQLHDNIAKYLDNRFNILLDAERENKPYIKGPEHGILHQTNGGGKEIKTVLRETDYKCMESVRVFFILLLLLINT